MTTEDKVRELAERIWRTTLPPSMWRSDPRMADTEKLLTDFATEQQRVGAERMRPLLAALTNEKVCSYSFCQKVACRCCHKFNHTWETIEHTETCDVLAAIRAIAVKTEGEKL